MNGERLQFLRRATRATTRVALVILALLPSTGSGTRTAFALPTLSVRPVEARPLDSGGPVLPRSCSLNPRPN